MAKFKITPTTTVAELKEQFRNEVGCVLRVYQGRSEASDEATLVSLGAKEGELECRTSRTVGKFEEAFQNDLNLKVKVYTKDNWVKVLDGITLATAAELPNGMTKAKMEEYLSYKRDEKEEAEELVSVSSQVEKPTDLSRAFENCQDRDINVSNLDTSEVTDMSSMFSECRNVSELDLGNFNTSNVKDMSYMFYGCERLEGDESFRGLNLSSFDTSKVESMSCMFSHCRNIQELDLSNFDVSNVEDFTGMFEDMSRLCELNLSNWNVREDAEFCDFLAGDTNELHTIIAKNCSEKLVKELIYHACGVKLITE